MGSMNFFPNHIYINTQTFSNKTFEIKYLKASYALLYNLTSLKLY